MDTKSIETLFTLPTTAFAKHYRSLNNSSDFTEKITIGKTLKERIIAGDVDLFSKYLIPLVTPLIERYKLRLPNYGTWREDFAQEAQVDFLLHLSEYEPYYNDGAIFIECFFKKRIRTVIKKFVRENDKVISLLSLNKIMVDDNDEYIELSDMLESKNKDDVHTTFVKEEVIRKYNSNQEKYTEYYARKVTRQWGETNGYDIFS